MNLSQVLPATDDEMREFEADLRDFRPSKDSRGWRILRRLQDAEQERDQLKAELTEVEQERDGLAAYINSLGYTYNSPELLKIKEHIDAAKKRAEQFEQLRSQLTDLSLRMAQAKEFVEKTRQNLFDKLYVQPDVDGELRQASHLLSVSPDVQAIVEGLKAAIEWNDKAMKFGVYYYPNSFTKAKILAAAKQLGGGE